MTSDDGIWIARTRNPTRPSADYGDMGVHSLKPDPDRSLGAGSPNTPPSDSSSRSPSTRSRDLPIPRGTRAISGRSPVSAPVRDVGQAGRARHAKPRASRTNKRTSTPFHQNKRVLLGAVIVAALVVSVVGYAVWRGAGPGRPCGPDYLGKEGSDVCADDRGTVAMDNLTVSATPLAATDNGSGGLTLCSDVTLSNNSGAKQDYNIQDFKIQNPGGQQDAPDPSVISGTLRSGSLGLNGTKTGRICDDRPAQKGLYALIYSPSLFDSQRGIWLSQH